MADQLAQNNENDFAVSLLTPWIKGNISVDNHFFSVDIPNTVFFGLIPAGKTSERVPLQNLSNISTSLSYKLGSMIIGALLVLIGFSSIGSNAGTGIILLLIGIILFLGGIKTSMTYEKNGSAVRIEFPFFEGQHVKDFANQAMDAIAKYQDDRNVAQVQASQTDRIVDAINNR